MTKLDKLRTMIIEHDQSYASLDEIMAEATQLLLEASIKNLESVLNETVYMKDGKVVSKPNIADRLRDKIAELKARNNV